MDTTKKSHLIETAHELFERFDQLNTIGAALSAERDLPRLLEQILIAAQTITHADGGTLYLMNDEETALRFEIMRSTSLGLALGGTTGKSITLAPLPLRDAEGLPNTSLVAAYAAIHDKTVNITDAYEEAGFDFSGPRAFDQQHGYRSKSFLTVPLKNHESRVIGVLQLINAKAPKTHETIPFPLTDQRLAESLASQAAIALTNRQLINQMIELFESLIDLINVAIDEKSPYTSGHCQRVPALTMMLAEAANATRTGPYAGFSMTEADRYELRMAGLLHDCGKITTPVHVVDKATKLQTLYDRIELVDTRIEVLKRDAQIRKLEGMLARRSASDPAADAKDESVCQAELAGLNEERDFLRKSNKGGEAMDAAEQQRVRDIATSRSWISADGQAMPMLSENEVENLTIRAGTLTGKERDIINNHIVSTIKMLKRLPWPKHLRNVPEFAGGHHERMDGKGYPNGLKKDEMSLQARMMGIADIFEALTAGDRPYKTAMMLSQALNILANFARNGHIDPDLFEIFMMQKVYMTYGKQFLHKDQMDEVERMDVLRIARGG